MAVQHCHLTDQETGGIDIIQGLFWSTLFVVFAVYVGYFVSMRHFAKKEVVHARRDLYPNLSLIIPTYNEAQVITRKLENIRELQYPRDRLEVLVVDSASTDATSQLASDFIEAHKPTLDVKLVTLDRRRGKASALNDTWYLCSGEITIITDADCLLEKGALYELVQNFQDPDVGVVTGSHVIVNKEESVARNLEESYRGIFNVLRKGESNLDSTPIVNGQLCAYRNGCIEKLYEDSVCDDIELALRIRKKGYRILYEPNAVFFEYTPRSMFARLAQKSRRAQGIIQQLWRFSSMMFKKAYGIYGFVILPFEFFFHIISPFLLTSLLGIFLLFVLEPSFLYVIVTAATLIVGSSLVLRQFRDIKFDPLVFLFTFIESNIYLMLGVLPLLFNRPSHKWEIVDEVRQISKQSSYP
jgi:cellulose synthase/poly-beta-1,6-N-acetylglucosamine synthase-like glycosyltransferase